MLIVKNQADAAKIKPGDQYIIDVFPPANDELQDITQAMLDQRDQLQEFIDKKLSQGARGEARNNP